MKQHLSFAKYIPTGNPTIILWEPEIPSSALSAVSAKLMHPMHLEAEQVGALYVDDGAGGGPKLAMMGGEFCVNATRSAALHLARKGMLQPVRLDDGSEAWLGSIGVSGAQERVDVFVSHKGMDSAILESCFKDFPESAGTREHGESSALPSMIVAARVDCRAPDVLCAPLLRDGIYLVSMPGMSHLLVDVSKHTLPCVTDNSWRDASAALRKEYELDALPASGVVWYEQTDEGCKIWPAVAVKATDSEHLETACGSASLALAIAMRQAGTLGNEPLQVTQPSGYALRVIPCLKPNTEACSPCFLSHAWISGPVLLVAEGTAYV